MISFSVGDCDEDIISSVAKNKVAVMFSATWCRPCTILSPEFAKLAAETPDVLFEKVDTDMFQAASQHFGVAAMPTFLFFNNGKCVSRLVGGSSMLLRESIRKLLAADADAATTETSLLDKYA